MFLDQFQVNEQDLEETVNSPAYHLLTQLLNDTPLLIKVIYNFIMTTFGTVSETENSMIVDSTC